MQDGEFWRKDPVVSVEKHLYPLVPRLMLHVAQDKAPDDALIRAVADAASTLRSAQVTYLDPIDITLSKATQSVFENLALVLTRIGRAIGTPDVSDATKLLDLEYLAGPFVDQIEQTLDALRSEFLGEVLTRQRQAQTLSTIAAKEVTSISRQIYFISINASVEAARAGDAGRGFAVIGEQIRGLSQDAAAALKRMSDHASPPQ